MIIIIRSHGIAWEVASALEGITHVLVSSPMGRTTKEGDDQRGKLPLQARAKCWSAKEIPVDRGASRRVGEGILCTVYPVT